jgi:hypothetical protein
MYDSIVDFFREEANVQVWEVGKNIATGWIGLQCIYCGDTSNHLGIRLKDLKCTCWKCGSHSIISLLNEIAGLSRKEAKELVKHITGEYIEEAPKTQPTVSGEVRYLLPPESTIKMTRAHRKFLIRRRFNPALITKKFDLRFVGNVGRYKFRIIIPITTRRNIVTFTSRSIYKNAIPPYLHADRKFSIISVKDTLYNIDSINQHHDGLLVEGAIDVWRWGTGAFASFGQYLTKAQYMAVKRAKIRNLFIMYDSDKLVGKKSALYGKRYDDHVPMRQRMQNRLSYYKAVEVWRILHPLVDKCELITNERFNDVARLNDRQVLEIKNELDFNKGR